jgi:asparagine synthase (glutamine-hydrolysing)
MCGIWAAINAGKYTDVEGALKALKARGPEYAAHWSLENVQLGFTRLAINGLTEAGNQPFHHDNLHLVCNGEIYNYKELAERHGLTLRTGGSDCEVLLQLYRKLSHTEFCRALDGVFALVIVDTTLKTVFVARDPYGVRPLFYTTLPNGGLVFASEIKALPRDCMPQVFQPGTYGIVNYEVSQKYDVLRYYGIPHTKIPHFGSPFHRSEAKHALNTALTEAVKKRLMSDRPVGALLSGGLDSSLVAALAARELKKAGKRLSTFSIGLPGSTDFEYAAKVAKHIDSDHHHIVCSSEDFLAAIPEVIKAIESYDITTVRASVGNYLVGKYIKENTDIKVVFNGDGSDEVGGGYLYFYNAPSDEAFESEVERLLSEIHLYDVLRSDRCMAAHGLEARTPFLDKGVVATWLSFGTTLRRPRKANAEGRGAHMEKQILREAFECEGLVPFEVLWRRKEAFSDGVSSTTDSWYLQCANYAKKTGLSLDTVCDSTAGWVNPPMTEEALWYRSLFHDAYGTDAAAVIPHMWLPRWSKTTDPSARTLKDIY